MGHLQVTHFKTGAMLFHPPLYVRPTIQLTYYFVVMEPGC